MIVYRISKLNLANMQNLAKKIVIIRVENESCTSWLRPDVSLDDNQSNLSVQSNIRTNTLYRIISDCWIRKDNLNGSSFPEQGQPAIEDYINQLRVVCLLPFLTSCSEEAL